MATTTEPRNDESAPGPQEEEGERSTRRLLVVLFIVLGVAALALLALLLWLLRPKPAEAPPGQAAGYPIEVVTTIYGYGQNADELMNKPLGVTFDQSGNVWVSDTGQSRVEVYTSAGEYIRTIGDQKGDGKLYAPFGIAIDNERSLAYVADMSNRAVQIYTTDGSYVGKLPSPEQDLSVFGDTGFVPYDIGFSQGRIVVSSTDGLYWFDQEGNVVARWGGTSGKKNVQGPLVGMFNFPNSFTIDQATGWIYVADSANRRVIALDPDGFVKWVSGTPDVDQKITSFWNLPRSIELGSDGNLYVVDTFRTDPTGMGVGHIVVLSKDGELLSEFGRTGSDDGAFSFPDQIASGPDGLWAIADRENNRVVVFRLNTPYPAVDDLLARRYQPGFDRPEFAWVTPPPTPPEQGQ